jgi:hypothetical protein
MCADVKAGINVCHTVLHGYVIAAARPTSNHVYALDTRRVRAVHVSLLVLAAVVISNDTTVQCQLILRQKR